MTKYVSLKSEVKAARGNNKTRLTAQLIDQQIGSINNEIKVMLKRVAEIKQQIFKLEHKKLYLLLK